MLSLKNVTKVFGRGTPNEKVVFKDFNFLLSDGDFLTVIGGNGAGKSTLLNLISGSLEADDGLILLDGQDITLFPEHKRAGMLGRVFQDPQMGTASDMNIEENLALANRRGKFHGLRWGITKKEREHFKELLKKLDLGLENRLEHKVGLLSGGQRQAITLLMAILNKPKLLLLDEHTAALDPRTAKKVLEITSDLVKEYKLTTIMITHNMKDALKYGNRTIMMSEGKVIADIPQDKKEKMQVEDLLKLFNDASKDDSLSDKTILG